MKRRLLVSIGSLLAIAFLFALGVERDGIAEAHVGHPGLDFSIGIDTDGDTSDDCNTASETTTCAIAAGAAFDVIVYLNSMPDGIAGYQGVDAILAFEGVTSSNQVDMDLWPDCVIEASAFLDGLLAFACSLFPPTVVSTYEGAMGRATFTCEPGESGSVTLLHGVDRTSIVSGSANEPHYEAEGGETLSITCDGSLPPPPPPPQPAYLAAIKIYAETREPQPGWEMTLYAGAGCQGEPLASGRTDERGIREFQLPGPGTYSVEEEDRAGWASWEGHCQTAEVGSGSTLLIFSSLPVHNGDVNIDGTSDSIDALLVLQDVVALVDRLPDEPQGDVDRDLTLTSIDSSLILQYDAGLVPSLPLS